VPHVPAGDIAAVRYACRSGRVCSPVLLVFQHEADLGPTLADRFCAPGRSASPSFVLAVRPRHFLQPNSFAEYAPSYAAVNKRSRSAYGGCSRVPSRSAFWSEVPGSFGSSGRSTTVRDRNW
jgi:hypothetical protein